MFCDIMNILLIITERSYRKTPLFGDRRSNTIRYGAHVIMTGNGQYSGEACGSAAGAEGAKIRRYRRINLSGKRTEH